MQRILLTALLLALGHNAFAANPRVELQTNRGKMVIELYTDKAPRTVANFLQYVKEGHYNGTLFHRVIEGFMIQAGGFDERYQQKPTRAPIANEANNGLKNAYGTVAMARTPDPNSASAQFFINVKDNDFLNFRTETAQGWGYTVFGKVTSGIEVVERIAKTPTGSNGPFPRDAPQDPVIIEKAVVLSE
jgi:peptidyl-prolyl cis-trans isomerase A (cyclophilin A)